MALYTAKEVQQTTCFRRVPGGEVPARWYNRSEWGYFKRLKHAFGVLTGRYDALDWEQGK